MARIIKRQTVRGVIPGCNHLAVDRILIIEHMGFYRQATKKSSRRTALVLKSGNSRKDR